jgi:hypothetical protein
MLQRATKKGKQPKLQIQIDRTHYTVMSEHMTGLELRNVPMPPIGAETSQRPMTLLEGIARGEKAIEEGRSLTHKQAKQRMSR